MLFVGNIVGNKGVEVVFEAVLRLRARRPDIRLQVVGEGRGLRRPAECGLPRRLEVNDRPRLDVSGK